MRTWGQSKEAQGWLAYRFSKEEDLPVLLVFLYFNFNHTQLELYSSWFKTKKPRFQKSVMRSRE